MKPTITWETPAWVAENFRSSCSFMENMYSWLWNCNKMVHLMCKYTIMFKCKIDSGDDLFGSTESKELRSLLGRRQARIATDWAGLPCDPSGVVMISFGNNKIRSSCNGSGKCQRFEFVHWEERCGSSSASAGCLAKLTRLSLVGKIMVKTIIQETNLWNFTILPEIRTFNFSRILVIFSYFYA